MSQLETEKHNGHRIEPEGRGFYCFDCAASFNPGEAAAPAVSEEARRKEIADKIRNWPCPVDPLAAPCACCGGALDRLEKVTASMGGVAMTIEACGLCVRLPRGLQLAANEAPIPDATVVVRMFRRAEDLPEHQRSDRDYYAVIRQGEREFFVTANGIELKIRDRVRQGEAEPRELANTKAANVALAWAWILARLAAPAPKSKAETKIVRPGGKDAAAGGTAWDLF